MAQFKLWGFDGSTYVRTVKMVLAEKGCTDFEQVQIDVLAGDPKAPEHLERHPFGKVPVLDHGDFRIIETAAICRYLNSVLPGPDLVPSDPKNQARMDMVTGIVDSYGYGALLGGVAAYHLFPDFVGGKNDAARSRGIQTGGKVVEFAMRTRGSDPFIAGPDISLADLYLAPILFYLSLTPDFEDATKAQGFGSWWERIGQRQSYKSTEPGLG